MCVCKWCICNLTRTVEKIKKEVDSFKIYFARELVKLEKWLGEGNEGEKRIQDDLQISDSCNQKNNYDVFVKWRNVVEGKVYEILSWKSNLRHAEQFH